MMGVDAAGLSLFAIAGTEKALQFKMHPFIAVVMGMITGVGGGVVRDVFLAQVPRVLRADVCHGGAGRSGGHDCSEKSTHISHTGCGPGRHSMLSVAGYQRVAALESTEDRDRINAGLARSESTTVTDPRRGTENWPSRQKKANDECFEGSWD